MSYPAWGGRGTSLATGTTTHPVVLPTDIAVGDLLLVWFSYRKDTPTPAVTWPAWLTDVLYSTSIFHTARSQTLYSHLRYRIADGTETAFNLTTDVVVTGETQCVRIHTGTYTGLPEAAVAVSSSAGATSHTPPLLTPSWGLAHTLWIAACAIFGNGGSAYPINAVEDCLLGYDWPIDYRWVGDLTSRPTSFCTVAKRSAVASLTPPPFTTGATEPAVTITGTVAIQGTATALGPEITEVTAHLEASNVDEATLIMPTGGAIDDVVLAVISAHRQRDVSDAYSFTWPADWTFISTTPAAGDPSMLLDVYGRVLDGTEPASYAIPYTTLGPPTDIRTPTTMVALIPGVGLVNVEATEQAGVDDPLPYPTHVGSSVPALWVAVFGALNLWDSSSNPAFDALMPFQPPAPGYVGVSTIHGAIGGPGLGIQVKPGVSATETPGATDLRGSGSNYASATIGLPFELTVTVVATLTANAAYTVGTPSSDTVTITE